MKSKTLKQFLAEKRKMERIVKEFTPENSK